MPVKKVVCTFCGREVTKRSTLSLQEIGGDEGRACRHHNEVKQLIDLKTQNEEIEEAARIIRVKSAAAMARGLHTFQAMSEYHIYRNMEINGWPKDFIEDVKAEVAEQGSLLLSEDEIQMAAFTAVHIMKHQNQTI